MEGRKRKRALFFFSDPENSAYLANVLIKNGWEINAPVHNILTLEGEGVDKQYMRESFWGDPNSFITPSIHTIMGIRARTRDRAMMEKHQLSRIDLVCVDFHAIKNQVANARGRRMLNIMKSESAKAFLLLAAMEGGKIPVCEPHDRKFVADWIDAGMPDKRNKMLRLIASSSLRIANELLNLGMYCDHLRK